MENKFYYKEIMTYLKNYIDSNILSINIYGEPRNAIIIPIKSEFTNYSIYLLKVEEIDEITLIPGEPLDYKNFKPLIDEKYLYNFKAQYNPVGYVELNEKEEELYDFKIKHYEDGKYTPGRKCKTFHRIEDKYDVFMKDLISSDIFGILKKNKLGKYLCVITEIVLRNFDLINKNSNKWFMNPNETLINKTTFK